MELFEWHLCRLSAPWNPAPYRGYGASFRPPERRNEGPRMPKWGRRVDVGGGIALGVVSRDVSAWILAFARMTNSGGPEVWLGTANRHGGFC